VLNYEKFQQRKRALLVQRLLHLPLDFVVFDEIQCVKQRNTHASHRKKALERLVSQTSSRNPDLCVLGMSATPVINNLQEGKRLLELIIGRPLLDLDTKHQTVSNALCLHRALMRYGFRFRPRSGQSIKIRKVPILRNSLHEVVKKAHATILQVEQALLPAKLEIPT